MEFHQLRYFVAAAVEMNISRAAEKVHISQPALSRQIMLLEEELGLPLFNRVKKRIQLTDAGRFFLLKARQILCDSELAIQQTQEQFGGARKTLRLGFISPLLDDLVAPCVREFQQRHSGSRIALYDLSPRAQLDRLKIHELDAAILANLDDHERTSFKTVALCRHDFVAVVPENHPLAERKSIDLAELRKDSWVSLSNAFFPKRREFLETACRKAGFQPRIVAETDSLPLMLAEIMTGGGVGIMPSHAAKLPHSGCVLLPLKSARIQSELLLVHPREKLSAEFASLIALIRERAAGL